MKDIILEWILTSCAILGFVYLFHILHLAFGKDFLLVSILATLISLFIVLYRKIK